MGQVTDRRKVLVALLASLAFLALIVPAQAAPVHLRKESLDITGLNHACGAAVDSKGDFYASSAGDSKIKVYNPSHTLLTEISDSNTPCGLAVTATGVVYVSEQATGEVVRFKPNAYPFVGTPTYGSREVIDASGKAEGIAVDRFDSGLYIAEGDRVAAYVNELQTVTLNSATAGTFKLKFEGSETAPIPFNASAAELKAALEALSTIGAGNIEVAKSGQVFSVFFVGKFALADVPTMGADASGLTAANPKLIVAETSKGFSGHLGEGTLTEASGVAAYAYSSGLTTQRYLWVADAKGLEADRLYLFTGNEANSLKLRRELSGTATPDGSFGFGNAGAYLAADPGNRSSEKCVAVAEQACSAGHLFLYDAGHKALDELDASGEYLGRTANAAFADAEPTAVAIDRSGGANDGTLYVTAGAGTGAKALAFGPLKAPKRETLKEPISHILEQASSVATDSQGDVYAGTGGEIHIYGPDGKEIVKFEDEFGLQEIAVDSACNVYVRDSEAELIEEGEKVTKVAGVTYYKPSSGSCPPTPATTYSRHEPTIVTNEEFPASEKVLNAIAVNPGPGKGKDQLFVTAPFSTRRYDSAANLSKQLDAEFAKCVTGVLRLSIAVNGVNGTVYLGANPNRIIAVSEAGTECFPRFDDKGSPSGKAASSPFVAVDQSNGHVIEYDGRTDTAHEYDAAGSFVAEFGNFTEGLVKPYRVAVDSACAIHEPPLDETTTPTCKAFDPANGNAYVAFDDTSTSHPPYDVTAFGPLKYGAGSEKFPLTVNKPGNGSGTVTSSPAGIDCGATCSAEFEEGKVVELKQEASSGSEFVKWGGPCSGLGQCKVAISEAKSVTAEFKSLTKSKFKLTISKTGAGSGSVTSSPAGIDCGGACNAEFEEGTEVTLSASPEPGSVFVGWSGSGCSGSCKVTMTEAKSVTATFTIEQHLLTVTTQGTGTGTVTSSPLGIDCGTECSASFNHGTTVTLTGTPGAKAKAVVWSGCDSVDGQNKCLATMSAAKSVTATFDLEAVAKFKLTISKTGAGSGSVTSSPAGIDCGGACNAEFEEGTEVTLSASPEPGSVFRQWSGACSGAGTTCKVTISEARSVDAFFSHAKQVLTVKQASASETTGTGTVSSKPKAIKCATACSLAKAFLYKDTMVLLTAKASKGSQLSGFSGCQEETKTETEGTCTVTMSAAKEVKVTYAGTSKAILNPKVLTLAKATGTGQGTVKATGLTCEAACTATSASYTSGDGGKKLPATVTLKAALAFGSQFTGWTGCESNPTPSECVVTMSEDHSVSVQFTAKPLETLTLTRSGNGTVSSKPKGVKCAAACSAAVASLPQGTVVELKAKAATGFEFEGWEGCEGETKIEAEGTCTVEMQSAKAVKATFKAATKPVLNPKVLTLAKAGSGYGTVKATGLTCEAACTATAVKYFGGEASPPAKKEKAPATVTLKATSQAGSDPVSWTGCESKPTPSECVVSMTGDREVVARFEE